MSTWNARSIPIWLPPVPGEGLDSWLEAYARRLATHTPHFISFLGLHRSSPRFMVRLLLDRERQILAERTGLAPEALTAMTLQPWDGLAVSIDPNNRTMRRPSAWRHYGNHSRYCPACLHDSQGRWQLAWRLPWSFACMRHSVLLLDRCPQCGHPPPVSSRGRWGGPSKPGICMHALHNGQGGRCDFPLPQATATDLPDKGLTLAAQQEVNRSVLGEARISHLARQQGAELYALGRRILRAIHRDLQSAPSLVGEAIAECGGDLPPLAVRHESNDAHNVALGTALAYAVHDSKHSASEELLTWLLADDRRNCSARSRPLSRVDDWLPCGPQVMARVLTSIDPELTLLGRIRYGTATATPSWPRLREEDIRRRASKVPAMLWPSWTMRLLPNSTPTPEVLTGFRRACAILLLLPGTTCDYRDAAKYLYNGMGKKPRQALADVFKDQSMDVLSAALTLLARALDEHPIPVNYQRRRDLFREDTLHFDLTAYRVHCRRHGQRISGLQVRILRRRLLRLLLGADPAPTTRVQEWHREYHYQVSDHLQRYIHDQAAANLAAHHINEPVQWEPPSDWITNLDWPGIDPGMLESQTITSMFLAGQTIQHVATTIDIDEAHLRLYVEAPGHTPQQTPAPESHARGRAAIRRELLAPARLRQLYQEEKRSQSEIAAQAGCSPRTVHTALRDAQIPIRSPSRPKILEHSVSRAWLEEEYLRKHRSAADIARELGSHEKNVRTLLRRWEIPRRPPGHWTNPFARLNVSLSTDMQAVCTTQNCLQRLRHLIQLPGQPSLAAAARTLGIRDPTLRYQIDRMEEATGATLITRGHPLRATPHGQQFIREAEHLLKLLDRDSL